MQGFQGAIAVLSGGPLVHVAKALHGRNVALDALLWNVQLGYEGQVSTVIKTEQHRAAIVTLMGKKLHIRSWKKAIASKVHHNKHVSTNKKKWRLLLLPQCCSQKQKSHSEGQGILSSAGLACKTKVCQVINKHDVLQKVYQQITSSFFFPNTLTISNTHVKLIVGSTTVTVLSWLTQASLFPLAEKQTLWTHPPLPAPPNSDITCPKGILDPHGVGAGFSSTSLMYAENTLRNKHANMIQNANKMFIFEIYIEG